MQNFYYGRIKTLRKISSILPANSRLTSVDLSATSARRPGAYSPYGESTKSEARNHRLENSGRIKLDKVSISEESKNIKDQTKKRYQRKYWSNL